MADKIVPIGDDDSIGERFVDLGDGTYVKPSATSPQVVILGKRKVGSSARALPAPGWAWTAGIWTLDGVDVSGQTNPAAYVRQAADVGKILGFKPTSPIQVGYGGATEIGTPDAPTNLVLTAIAGGVSAAFTAVPSANNGGAAITSYRVRLSDGNFNEGASSPIVVNSSSVDPVTGQVHAINSAGSGDRSLVSNAVTPIAITVPGAPIIGVATAGNGIANINWSAPSNTGGAAIAGYKITGSNGNVVTAAANATTVALPATNGTPVTAVVQAINSAIAQYGPPSAASNAVTPAAIQGFNTVQSYSTGQQVIYASGLYTFTANHPAGNWTGADVTYNGQVPGARAVNTVGVQRPFGINNFTFGSVVTATTSVPASTRGVKTELEAPATRVKIFCWNKEPNPRRGFAVSVAATETAAYDTISNAVDPIVGGVAYSVPRASDARGFLRLTWPVSGTRSMPQMPAGTTEPAVGYMSNQSEVVSDWAAFNTVPNIVPGKRPLAVFRMNSISNAGDSLSNISGTTLQTEYNKYAAGNTGARLMFYPTVGNGDHVADPTLSHTGTMYDPTGTGGFWTNIGIAADYNIPTRCCIGIGDSVTEGYEWPASTVLGLSTQTAPCTYMNFGISSNTQAQYLAQAYAHLRGENYVTDAIVPTFSLNEPAIMSDAYVNALIAALDAFLDFCVAKKVRVTLWTSYGQYIGKFIGGGPTSVAQIQRINDYYRAEAARPNPRFFLADIAAGWNNSTMILGDNTHPNATGKAYFVATITPVFQIGA